MNRSGLSIPKFITLHSVNALNSGVYATEGPAYHQKDGQLLTA